MQRRYYTLYIYKWYCEKILNVLSIENENPILYILQRIEMNVLVLFVIDLTSCKRLMVEWANGQQQFCGGKCMNQKCTVLKAELQ